MTSTGFNPEMINQGNTGVAIDHRNRGLGRWLKAALIKHVLSEMPKVTKIRSENDVTNEPMLNINNQMGFKPIYSESYWMITTLDVNKYLNAK